MRTSPAQPAPGPIKTAAMLATPAIMAAVFAAMLVYGWCAP